MKSTPRKVLLWLIAIVASLLLLVLAMPLWFPWLLRPVGRKAGLHYQTYVREGYSRFELKAVSYTNAHMHVTARKIRVFVPSIWAWHHFRSDKSLRYAEATDWNLALISGSTVQPRSENSTYTNAQKIGATISKIDQWLPGIALSNGLVELSNRTVQIGELVWQNGTLLSTVKAAGFMKLEGRIGPAAPWQLQADYEPLPQQEQNQAINSPSNLLVSGAVFFETNRFDCRASFARTSSLPQQASIGCASFSIPAGRVKLQNYGDIKGALSLLWNGDSFASEVSANAAPVADSKLPTIDVRLSARGDLHHAQIEELKIATPAMRAELANRVTLPMTEGAPPAILHIAANLAQQPWIALEGSALGEVRLTPGTNSIPTAVFNIHGTNISNSQLKAKNISLAGTLNWPWLELRRCRAEFLPESVAEVAAKMDLSRKEVRDGELHFEGARPLGVLPEKYRIDHVTLSAEFDGPLGDLRHREKVDLRGISSGSIVCSNATVTATGQGRNVAIKGTVNEATSALQFSFSANGTGQTNDIQLAELTLSSHGQPLLALQKPAQARIGRSAASTTRQSWLADISPIALSGPAGELTLDANLQWPEEGRVAGRIRRLALHDFGEFVPAKFRSVAIEDFQLQAQWQRGPATLLIVASGSYTQDPGFTLQAEVRGDSEGLNISNLTVASQSAPVVSAHGFLPFTFNPANSTNAFQWEAGRALALKAGMQPDQKFWQRVAELSKIQVTQPELNIDIAGPWNSPTGWVHASVLNASFSLTNRAIPSFENLRLDARLDSQQVRVEQLQFLVQKQPVMLTAELPLDGQFYDALLQRKVPNWKRGNARLRIGHAPIAGFIRYMPKVLMPLGAFDLDVAMKGGSFDGHFSLEGATTQPLGELGAIRDINAVFRLKQRSVLFERVHATVGGEALEASGSADFTDMKFGKGELPPFHVKVSGANIPLARKPEAIIRSDIDLAVTSSKTNQPLISGTVTLRNSFYTSDLESLIPGRVTKASERPPYFSIEVEPIANWRLDCRVKGDRFLKLHTPFFRGTISADFKLEGTLREPLASGEARVASGEVDFPFGTLDMKQGFVSLTAANPFQPQIYANARARRFGYDITMEVTGSADKPLVQFSSVPSLSSDQVFLLLTAGELPREEITFTPQQRAQRFAVYLGQRLLAKLGFGGGSERLTIRSGEDISESGRQTYDVEYKLDRDWSIVGQYDRFNAFNLSLKRRIFSH